MNMPNCRVENERQIISDIEDMVQMVELEALSLPLDFIPPGKKYDAEREAQQKVITEFKAAKYIEWIKKFAPKYAVKHPYLHFQLARICTLSPESVVRVVRNLREGFNQVSFVDRERYRAEAHAEVAAVRMLSMSKLPTSVVTGVESHVEYSGHRSQLPPLVERQ